MILEVRTLWVVIMAIYLVFGMVQLSLWMLRRDDLALLYWGQSNLATGSGCLLLGLQGILPDLMAVTAGNTLVVLGYGLMWAGSRRFADQPVYWRWVLVPPLLAAALLLFYDPLTGGMTERVLFMCAALGLSCAVSLHDALHAQRIEPLTMRQLAVASYAVTFIYIAARVAVTLDNPPGQTLVSMAAQRGSGQSLVIALALLLPVTWNLALLLMASERQERRLLLAAQADSLTRLSNRSGFLTQAAAQLRRARKTAQPCALLLIDMDHFAGINRSYGHEAGDRLLCAFADLVRRRVDAQDLTARLGSEEFCVLVSGRTADQALDLAERIRSECASLTVAVGEARIAATVSIGVAQIRSATDEDVERALARAGRVLYAAKRQGRNQVCVFTDPAFQELVEVAGVALGR